MNHTLAAALSALLLLPAGALAQELAAHCAQIPADPTRRFCNLVAEAVEIGQPRLGLSLNGGNPVPGAASTLGMRLGAIPRLSLGGRITAVLLELPPIEREGSTAAIKAAVPSLNLDASVGILSGWSLLPTVGGVGSLDLVGSVGLVAVPEGEGFAGNRPSSWALGARVGILRESFTAPGVSITGTYRRVSDIEYGDSTFRAEHSFFRLADLSVLSVRGVVGKRLLMLGASAGVGYDKYSSHVAFGVRNPSLPASSSFHFREDGFDTSRRTLFGSLQFTLVVLSIIGELGWQSGGDAFTAPLPAGQSSRAEKSSYFGSVALRLAI